MAEGKTNAIRMIERAKAPFSLYSYPHKDSAVDGITVAGLIGEDPAVVYKTLVTRGASRELYVFVIPVAQELDLKAAARAVGEKSIEMIHVSEIQKLTGYIRGGCSPVGMKKSYPTVIDAQARSLKGMIVSAGRIGSQVKLVPEDLASLTNAKFAPVATVK